MHVSCVMNGQNNVEKNSFDLQAGATLSFLNIVEASDTKGFSTGMTASIRYTRLLSNRWGAFVQLECGRNRIPDKLFRKRLGSQEDGSFTYTGFKTGKDAPLTSYLGAFAGAIYRYDIGKVSVRPAIAAGIAEYFTKRYNYYKWDNTDSGTLPQAVIVSPDGNEDARSISKVTPAFKGSIQLKYYITDILHIGADLDLTFFSGRYESHAHTYRTEKREWNAGTAILGAIVMAPLWVEEYETKDLISEKVSSYPIPLLPSVKFSIGWDF